MPEAQDLWDLYGGRDPRDLPSYTSWDAARYVRLPLRTVQNSSFGFGTYGGEPLIRVADLHTTRSPTALSTEPRFISLDPRVRFGRPVIVGTGIPTEEVAERFRAGDTCSQLAEEYGRPPQEIEEAIRCELTLDRAA